MIYLIWYIKLIFLFFFSESDAYRLLFNLLYVSAFFLADTAMNKGVIGFIALGFIGISVFKFNKARVKKILAPFDCPA